LASCMQRWLHAGLITSGYEAVLLGTRVSGRVILRKRGL